MDSYEASRDLPVVNAIVDRRLFLQDLCRGKKVVHLGCVDDRLTTQRAGTGSLLHEEIQKVAVDLVGVDISPAGIALLKTFVPGRYVVGDVEQLTNIDLPAQCDVVLAPELIEHLECPGRFLRELRSYLESSGAIAVLSTPNAYSWSNFLRYAGLRREWVHPDHLSLHSPSTLLSSLERAGLRPVALYAHAWARVFGWRNAGLTFLERAVLRYNPLLATGLVVEVRVES